MEEKDPKEPEKTANQGGEPPKEPLQELEEKLLEAEKQREYYKDLFLRKAAEFDNFKRRAEADSIAIVRFANEDLLAAVLPIISDLERSLKQGKELQSNPFYKGVELIYQKLLKILEMQGVKPFETVGKEFNVDFHDALLQIPKEDVPPHTVVEEVEKGYMYHDKVLRHAKVIVSAAPSDTESSSTQEQAGGDNGNAMVPKDK